MNSLESSIDTVINALSAKGCKVTKGNGQTYDYQAQCPAHPDKNPSLTLTGGRDGRALLKCHGGCSTEAIVEALDLRMADLFEPSNNDHAQQAITVGKPFWFDAQQLSIQKIYDYVDENAVLLFQAVRLINKDTGDKTFRQRRPDGNGGWYGDLKGVRRVLYNLPTLAEAFLEDNPVYIVEGEKCCDALTEKGLTATCNPMGAKKWDDSYSQTLSNLDIAIIPDNDKPGKEHAELVADKLLGRAKSIKIVELPDIDSLGEKADVYDWLEAEHTINELKDVLANTESLKPDDNRGSLFDDLSNVDTPPNGIKAGDLLMAEFAPTQWVVEGLIPEGLTILSGRPKTGKSFLVLDVAIAVATGGRVLDWVQVEPGPTLYLALEDNKRRLQQRLKLLVEDGTSPDLQRLTLIDAATGWKVLDRGGLEMLDSYLDNTPETKLVIIDTLQKIKPNGHRNKNAYENDYAALGELHRLASRRHVAIVIVHHTRKSESLSGDVFDEVSGSLGITGVADTNIVIKRQRNSANATLSITGRDVTETEYALTFGSEDDCRWRITGDASEVNMSSSRQSIIEILRLCASPLNAQELLGGLKEQGINMNPNTLRWHLTTMADDGDIRRADRGRYSALQADVVRNTSSFENNIENNSHQHTNKQTNTDSSVCNSGNLFVCWSTSSSSSSDSSSSSSSSSSEDCLFAEDRANQQHQRTNSSGVATTLAAARAGRAYTDEELDDLFRDDEGLFDS